VPTWTPGASKVSGFPAVCFLEMARVGRLAMASTSFKRDAPVNACCREFIRGPAKTPPVHRVLQGPRQTLRENRTLRDDFQEAGQRNPDPFRPVIQLGGELVQRLVEGKSPQQSGKRLSMWHDGRVAQ